MEASVLDVSSRPVEWLLLHNFESVSRARPLYKSLRDNSCFANYRCCYRSLSRQTSL